MRDCVNTEMRDLLPDVMAVDDGISTLSEGDRARVAAHLSVCADCRAELELLRAARRATVAAAPAVDVARIVQALPAPASVERAAMGAMRSTRSAGQERRATPRTRRRSLWSAWRIAAVISTVAVGGLSIAVLQDTTHVKEVPLVKRRVVVPATAPAKPGLSVGTSMTDVDDADLEALLRDMDSLEATPAEEPDAAAPSLHALGRDVAAARGAST